MIPALLLLLMASSGRLPLLDETVEVPAGEWRSFDIELDQSPAAIECRHAVLSGGAGVRVSLMHRADLERLRAGIRHRDLAATGYAQSSGFVYGPGPLGGYSVVVDNRVEGRRTARVRLMVALLFPAAEPMELSSGRRLVVILATIAAMSLIAGYTARRLKGALSGRRPENEAGPSL